jgi:hypothetical protein
MAKSVRIKGTAGFTAISGKPCFTAAGSRVFTFRDAGVAADKLAAMSSSDRGDFIREAIAEKLERDSI